MTEKPSENNELKELTNELFGNNNKWGEFLKEFNHYFPMPHSYQSDKSLKFSPQAIKNHHISCAGASMLMYHWAKTNKPEYKPIFLTKRKPEHTHVYLGLIERNEDEDSLIRSLRVESIRQFRGEKPHTEIRWYNLTLENGLYRIENNKIPAKGIDEAGKYYYNFIPKENEPLQQYQLFTFPEIFKDYFNFDKEHRESTKKH